jgi:hypothetical protein
LGDFLVVPFLAERDIASALKRLFLFRFAPGAAGG